MNARPQSPAKSRALILERIRTALTDHPATPPVPRDYQQSTPAAVDVLALFVERVEDYSATVRRVPAADLASVIAAAFDARGIRRIAVPADLPQFWLSGSPSVEAVPDAPQLGVHELDEVDGVLTGCAVGIAETGTIVLDAGAAQGRRAITLLPDYHLCVIEAAQIVGSVAEGLRRLDPTRPLTWISGPSATSDIELNRVEGVHGPRVLDVLLIT